MRRINANMVCTGCKHTALHHEAGLPVMQHSPHQEDLVHHCTKSSVQKIIAVSAHADIPLANHGLTSNMPMATDTLLFT